jgi:hypothetical protein
VIVLIWLAVWLVVGTPHVEPWNDWFVSLVAASVTALTLAIYGRPSSPTVQVLPLEGEPGDEGGGPLYPSP